jgi:hypothetical protein
MGIKRWLGVDLVDLVIQVGVTITVMVIAIEVNRATEDIAAATTIGLSLVLLGVRRHRNLLRQATEAGGERGAELEARVAELEDLLANAGDSIGARLAEVEGRLDFAERLLAKQAEAPRLPEDAKR